MLKVVNVTAAYGPIVALRGVSLEVPDGAVVALLGANGAGKSTTLRLISGLMHPVDGVVEYEGHRIDHRPPQQIVAMGISHVPEGRELFMELTVEENLRLGAYHRRDGNLKADISRIYEYFPRLQERRKQPANRLSGGEQQMLAIGRALMARPQVLLLDEPSLGLAPLLVRELFRVICRLRDQGYTVLLVEQNAHQALRVADVAYVMETGTVTLKGSGAELLATPQVQAAYLGGTA